MNEEIQIQIRNLDDRIKSLWHATNEIKEQNKDFEKRLTELEITKGETREQLNSIKDFLERIEKSIEALTTEIGNIKKQPIQNYEKIKWILATALTSSIVGAVVGFILKKIIGGKS